MAGRWSAEDVRLVDAAAELEIAVRRSDGSLRRWLPIWVASVTADVDDAYRTTYGPGGAGSMVTAAAVATTLRLRPE